MFVLLDEPAAGLSPAEAEVFKDAVRMMARAGLGVLIVEHNLPIVFDIADEVTVLDEGQVIATGTPAEVSRDPIVVRVYIGRQRLDRPGGDGSTTATLAPGTT
jgi:ABC-type branched-subunit amino acid transport system ATPase component